MATPDPVQATSEELLIAKLNENVHIACTGSVDARLAAVDLLIRELRESSSSMTAVPKPMRHLLPSIPLLQEAFSNFPDPLFRRNIADLLSLLTIVNCETSYDMLLYRLACPIDARDRFGLARWGHEYVRLLTLVVIRAHAHPDELPPGTDLSVLVSQIASYYMDHNDEPDACDFLMAVGKLPDIVLMVKEETHTRVCTYLLQCYDFLPDPVNANVLNVVYDIYVRLKQDAQALVIALKMNDREKMHELFFGCVDPLVRKQLAFLLARQLTVFEDEFSQELTDIATNVDLCKRFSAVAAHLRLDSPRTPDDVLQLQQTLGPRQPPNRPNKTYTAIAKSYVNGFANAALKKDHYYMAERGMDALARNDRMALAVAVASLGMVNLWEIENFPMTMDRILQSERDHMVMGGLAAIGIMSSAIRSEFDAPLALIPEHLDAISADVVVGGIFGLAMAYAGSARSDLLAHFQRVISMHNGSTESDVRIVAYATLAIGLVYVGTCQEDALTAITQILITPPRSEPEFAKYLPMMGLGLGLVYLGKQGQCGVALELLTSEIRGDEAFAAFVHTTVQSCAFAGTGNVLKIQENLQICAGDDSVRHASAVIGIASIALGEAVGCQMAKRMLEHILQYGKPFARRMVPIALALTSVSNAQPEIIDTLQRIGHDVDIAVANNAAVALGLLAAGTANSRALKALHNLRDFHKNDQATFMLTQIAEGMVHLGQGLMTLSPTYGDSRLVHPVGLAALLIVAYSCIRTEELVVKTDPLLLFFVAPAISPRFLVTLDENLEMIPVQVRVGTAIDVVGQAGRPRAITGFQTLDTPVILAAGQRAEFVDDSQYEALSPILEGFVIVRKRGTKTAD
jgi:26S proteasome regulatory subunit N1